MHGHGEMAKAERDVCTLTIKSRRESDEKHNVMQWVGYEEGLLPRAHACTCTRESEGEWKEGAKVSCAMRRRREARGRYRDGRT